MRTTIDKAGRLVVPRPLRDQIGLLPGEVDIEVDGAGLRIEPVAAGGLVRENGRWVLKHGFTMTDDEMRELRLAPQQ